MTDEHKWSLVITAAAAAEIQPGMRVKSVTFEALPDRMFQALVVLEHEDEYMVRPEAAE